jgi:hypothetical protein
MYAEVHNGTMLGVLWFMLWIAAAPNHGRAGSALAATGTHQACAHVHVDVCAGAIGMAASCSVCFVCSFVA